MSSGALIGSYASRVTGLAERHQFIRIVCGEQRGAVPNAPDLGVDWLAALDLPLPEARPILMLDIQTQLKKFAPDIEVLAVEILNVQAQPGAARARVTWKPINGDEEEQRTEL